MKYTQKGGGELIVVFLILIMLGGGVFVGLGVTGTYDPLNIFGKKKNTNTNTKDCVGSWSKCVSASSDKSGSCYKTYTIKTQSGPGGTACPVKDKTRKKCVFPGDCSKIPQKDHKCNEGYKVCGSAANKNNPGADTHEINHSNCPVKDKYCNSKCSKDKSITKNGVLCYLYTPKTDNEFLMRMKDTEKIQQGKDKFDIKCPSGYKLYDTKGRNYPPYDVDVSLQFPTGPAGKKSADGYKCVTFEVRAGAGRDSNGKCKKGYVIGKGTGKCEKPCSRLNADDKSKVQDGKFEWISTADKSNSQNDDGYDYKMASRGDPSTGHTSYDGTLLSDDNVTCTLKTWTNLVGEKNELYCNKTSPEGGTCFREPLKHRSEDDGEGGKTAYANCMGKRVFSPNTIPTDWPEKCPYKDDVDPTTLENGSVRIKGTDIYLIEGDRQYKKYKDGRDCKDNNIECTGNDWKKGCVKNGVYYKKTLKECADMCDAWEPCKGFTRKAGDWCILKDEACDEDDADHVGSAVTFYRKRFVKKNGDPIPWWGNRVNGLVRLGASFLEESGFPTESCTATGGDDPQYMKKCIYTKKEHSRFGDGR